MLGLGTGNGGFRTSTVLPGTVLQANKTWAGESADLGHTSALPLLSFVTLDKSLALSEAQFLLL